MSAMLWMKILWGMLLAGLLGFTFHRAWRWEHGASPPALSARSVGKETFVFVPPTVLFWVLLLLTLLFMRQYGVSDGLARAAALARAFWPGALTIVLDAEGGGTEGVRVPDHAVARSLCRAAGGLLRCTSANRSGEPPALEAAAAADAIPEADALVDAGPAPGGVASTVVRFAADGSLVILREGAIPRSALEEALRTVSA